MRGSSVHFKRISSAAHSVSHASREVPPQYLLPADLSLGTFVVIDDSGQVQKLLSHKLHLASRQAKATKDYSPMWEGVINLPDPADVTPQQQIEIVKEWCLQYETMTGHKVIRADVHLDEGFVDEAGKPQFNAHAHVMADRTDDKGKVKKLTSTVLREVQTMTAKVTTLQRGLDARTTRRKHIGHQNFRFDAEKNRLNLDGEKTKTKRYGQLLDASNSNANTARSKLRSAGDDAGIVRRRAARLLKLKTQYKLDRAALKASGLAKQADYQALKKTFDDQAIQLATAQAAADRVPLLEAQIATIQEKYKTLHGQALKIQEERNLAQSSLAKAHQKVEVLSLKNVALEAHNAIKLDPVLIAGQPFSFSRPTLSPVQKTPAQVAIAPETQRHAAMAQPFTAKLTRTSQEAAQPQSPPTPSPTPGKSVLEVIQASFEAFVLWIKGEAGEHVAVNAHHSLHCGPVVQVDDLHAVQKVGKAHYAVHQLKDLDNVPVLGDSKTEIHYRGGVGQVKGRDVERGGLGD